MTRRESHERAKEIRDLFKALGSSLPIRDLTKHAIDAGLISETDLETLAIRAAQEICRRALAEEDARGLPFAQPDADEDEPTVFPVWKQIDLFTYDQLAQLIDRRTKQVRGNYAALRRLVDYCQTRFGTAPEVTL